MLSTLRAPHHSHMRTKESRLGTYYYGGVVWPRRTIRAQPHILAEAGLFYIGESDRVKCWYCNGGLENWERDDDPWREHAKWYPHCVFLLQEVGTEFVHRVTVESRIPLVVSSGPNYSRSHQPSLSTSINRPILSISPPVEVNRNGEELEVAVRVESFMESSPFVRTALRMGFSHLRIRQAVKSEIERNNRVFQNTEEIIDALNPTTNMQNTLGDRATSHNAEDFVELRSLEERRSCKRCRHAPARTVFLPCCHLCCCTACSSHCHDCPVCGSVITEKIQSFIC